MDAVRFAATLAALYAAHQVADHWVQTHHQATSKALPGAAGHLANIAHVTSYTATMALVIAVLGLRFDLGFSPPWVVAGLAVTAISHAWADRRSTLRALAVRLGKGDYWDHRGGAYPLDQAWHIGWLLISSLIIAA